MGRRQQFSAAGSCYKHLFSPIILYFFWVNKNFRDGGFSRDGRQPEAQEFVYALLLELADTGFFRVFSVFASLQPTELAAALLIVSAIFVTSACTM